MRLKNVTNHLEFHNMSILKNVFLPKHELLSVKDILMWYESRRPLFNLVSILVIFIGTLLIHLAFPNYINLFMLPFAIAYLIFLNICYLISWIPLIALRNIWGQRSLNFMVSMFNILMFMFAVFLSIGACVIIASLKIP